MPWRFNLKFMWNASHISTPVSKTFNVGPFGVNVHRVLKIIFSAKIMKCFAIPTSRWCILKSRHYFANKGPYCQNYGYVFSIVMYGSGSWTIKNAECQRIDAFKLWCWRRRLRVPWTARRSNKSILKEINPESVEGLMLKLELQYFGHVMQRADSLEKTLMLGKIEGRRRRGWQRMKWVDGITDSMDMTLSKLGEIVEDREAWQCCSAWRHYEFDVT